MVNKKCEIQIFKSGFVIIFCDEVIILPEPLVVDMYKYTQHFVSERKYQHLLKNDKIRIITYDLNLICVRF